MSITKLLASALLATAITSASAFEASVILPIASKHLSSDTIPNSDRPYNSKNTGAAVSLRTSGDVEYGIQLGSYKNSYYNTSTFVAGEVRVNTSTPVSVGILVGAVTGYESSTKPLVSPYAAVDLGFHSELILNYIPTTLKNGSSAVSVSYGVKF